MILVGYTWLDVAEGMSFTSLGILLMVMIYKRILKSLSKGAIDKDEYCELYSLEIEPASGELPFYFTSAKEKKVSVSLLDSDMNFLQEIAQQDCKVGGNIIRFDSTQIPNGNYYYCLKTDNQKVMKKMRVLNS